MLLYIRSTITAYRRVKLEPVGVESICLDVKGSQNVWFLICACYRSPSKCKISDFISSCTTAANICTQNGRRLYLLVISI